MGAFFVLKSKKNWRFGDYIWRFAIGIGVFNLAIW